MTREGIKGFSLYPTPELDKSSQLSYITLTVTHNFYSPETVSKRQRNNYNTWKVNSTSGAGTNLKVGEGGTGPTQKLEGNRSGVKRRKKFLVVPLHFFWL